MTVVLKTKTKHMLNMDLALELRLLLRIGNEVKGSTENMPSGHLSFVTLNCEGRSVPLLESLKCHDFEGSLIRMHQQPQSPKPL